MMVLPEKGVRWQRSVFAMVVPTLLMPYLPSFINLLFTGVIAISTQALPGMSMFCCLIITTSVSEFMAAMDKLHISKKFTVPVSAMFRFFSTIEEEYAAIRDGAS